MNTVCAVEVGDLYQAKIELASQSTQDKAKAQQLALKQVLIKLAGSKVIKNNALLKAAIRAPKDYLSQYSYSKTRGVLFLFASFEQHKINKLLQLAQVGIWGKHRPLTTIWLVNEQDGKKNLIGDSLQSEIKDIIDTVAFNRGLPINFPLNDLTDLMNVSVTDVWGRFSQTVIEGSQRYAAESVLILRISNSTLVELAPCEPNCVKKQTSQNTETQSMVIDWSLWFNGKNYQNSYQGTDQQKLLTSAINDVSDRLFEYNSFVLAADNQGTLDLEITGIESMQQFVDINSFFRNLSLVSDVKLLSTKGNTMVFRLNISAQPDAVKQALQLERKLELMDEFFNETDSIQPVIYRWKG